MLDRGEYPTTGQAPARHHIACKACGRLVEQDIQATCLHVLQACPRAPIEARTEAIDSIMWLIDREVKRAVARANTTGSDKEIVIRQTYAAWMERLGPAADLIAGAHGHTLQGDP